MLPVVSAVVNKRQVAASITVLGSTPQQVLLDEALTLIERGLTRRPGLADTAWRPARAAVDQLADRRRLLRGFLAFEGRQCPPDIQLRSDEPAPADEHAASSEG